MKKIYSKRRERFVIFLDDGFGKKTGPNKLRQAGYEVEVFSEHFKHKDGKKQESVKDPQIIRFCNRKKWLLVTTDKDIVRTHAEDIKNTEIAILATASNNAKDQADWIEALIKARLNVERKFRKHPRPWFAQFNRQGAITTIYQVGCNDVW